MSDHGEFRVAENLTALRAIKARRQNEVVLVKDVVGDGGLNGEEYIWKSDDTTADDGQISILPADLVQGKPGRWRLIE